MAKVKYEMTLKFTIMHDVDSIKDTLLKSDREYAQDVCKFVADECVNAGGYVAYEIMESKIDATT